MIGQPADCADGWLGNSVFAKIVAGREGGAPPPVDLDAEKAHGQFVREQIAFGQIKAAHDISDGGLLVALTEMALSGNLGADINIPKSDTLLAWAFGEDQARYLVQVEDAVKFQTLLDEHNFKGHQIGTTKDSQILTVGPNVTISLEEIRRCYENRLPEMMA